MASLLEGQLASAIYAGFKGKLLKGVLTRNVPSDTLDSHGDPVGSTPQTFKLEGFVESFSLFYRKEAGIPEKDVAVMIFAESINPKTVPTVDDRVTFRGTTYQLRKLLEVDPAVATYRFSGYLP